MSDTDDNDVTLEQVAEIVSAYVSNNSVPCPSGVGALVRFGV